MGIISIDVRGSFGEPEHRDFLAQKSGHVVAAEDAIKWLRTNILRPAQALDRQLRMSPDAPDDNWAAFDERHPFKPPMPGDVIAEKSFVGERFDTPMRFSHCEFSDCVFHEDCIFTDCVFSSSVVMGELIKCGLDGCVVVATVFIDCQARRSDVTVCHVKSPWEDDE